jgi:Zn-dependent peptidase ImmA (M78 family)
MRSIIKYLEIIYEGFNKEILTLSDLEIIANNERISIKPVRVKNDFNGFLCYGYPHARSVYPTIFYNANKTNPQKYFEIAHEFAHYFLHSFKKNDLTEDENEKLKNILELEANLFASMVLYPDQLLEKHFGKKIRELIKSEDGAQALSELREEIRDFMEKQLSHFLREKPPERMIRIIPVRIIRFIRSIEEDMVYNDNFVTDS